MEEAPLTTLTRQLAPKVVALTRPAAGQSRPPLDVRQAFLSVLAVRVAFLQVLADRGWMHAPATYLSDEPGPHLAYQKVNSLFINGLHQQSLSARRILSGRFGPVPFIGPPFAPREWIESSCQFEGNPLVQPSGFFAKLQALDPTRALEEACSPLELPRNLTAPVSCLASGQAAAEAIRMLMAARILEPADQPFPLPDLTAFVAVNPTPETLPDESGTIEYKATFEFDRRTGARNPAHATATLKTLCAFLNSQGGTLTIGVDDQLAVIGLDGDFSLIKDLRKQDTFENRFREAVKNHIDPLPLHRLTVSFPQIGGKTLCKIAVEPDPERVTYLVHKDQTTGQPLEDVFVRDGNRTISLKGRHRDEFVLSRPRSTGTIQP